MVTPESVVEKVLGKYPDTDKELGNVCPECGKPYFEHRTGKHVKTDYTKKAQKK